MQSYVEQERTRPDDGMSLTLVLDKHLTMPCGDNLSSMVDTRLGPNLEGADLTNPLSTGPSTFTTAATGRTCKFSHFLPSLRASLRLQFTWELRRTGLLLEEYLA
jgi:hypothetical protein